jgi:hypothetical protein
VDSFNFHDVGLQEITPVNKTDLFPLRGGIGMILQSTAELLNAPITYSDFSLGSPMEDGTWNTSTSKCRVREIIVKKGIILKT